MNSQSNGTQSSSKFPERKKIIEEMFTEAEKVIKERFPETGEDLSWLLTCLTVAHLSNYVHHIIPQWKKGLLDLATFLAEVELEKRRHASLQQTKSSDSSTDSSST